MQENIARGGVEKVFFTACWQARNSSRDNGLRPIMDADGEWRYLPQQGIKAACWGREDAAATLTIQMDLLKAVEALQRLKGLLWLCVALLAYIAYKIP
jgi:hypothetical protein